MKRKETLIAIIFFALGGSLVYGYYSNELAKKSRQLTAFTNACIRVQQIDQEIQSSCEQSFVETMTCISDPHCNQQESVKRFQSINIDNYKLEQEKKSIADELFKLTEDNK